MLVKVMGDIIVRLAQTSTRCSEAIACTFSCELQGDHNKLCPSEISQQLNFFFVYYAIVIWQFFKSYSLYSSPKYLLCYLCF